MKQCKLYEYNGKEHTLDELAGFSHLPKHVLANRLKNGWDVAAAINEPDQAKIVDSFKPEMYDNGNIDIFFTRHIAGVFQEMQPELGKIYSAEPHYQKGKMKAKLYYIIWLDDHKPLIVYPGEFEWILSDAA